MISLYFGNSAKMKDHSKQHTERQGVALVQLAVHKAQWIFREHKEVDHGIDAHIESIIEGEVSGRLIALQIKSGSSYFEEETKDGFVFRGESDHLDYWLNHSLPVLLLLVDPLKSAVYWAHVTPASIESTGKGWKITVPKRNLLDGGALEELEKIAVNLRISRPYSRLELNDASHGGAKRYSANILLNGDFPREYVESLASEITKQTAIETWMENPELERRFFGRQADVVYLYIYRTPDDAKQANWVCRTQWISPELVEQFRPIAINADTKPGEVGVVWSDHRAAMEAFALARETTKGEAAKAMTFLASEAQQHLETHRGLIESFIENPQIDFPLLPNLRTAAKHARNQYSISGDLGIPPLELADLGDAFSAVMASFDNVFMLFSQSLDSADDVRRAAFLSAGYLKMFDRDLQLFIQEARRRNIRV